MFMSFSISLSLFLRAVHCCWIYDLQPWTYSPCAISWAPMKTIYQYGVSMVDDQQEWWLTIGNGHCQPYVAEFQLEILTLNQWLINHQHALLLHRSTTYHHLVLVLNTLHLLHFCLSICCFVLLSVHYAANTTLFFSSWSVLWVLCAQGDSSQSLHTYPDWPPS